MSVLHSTGTTIHKFDLKQITALVAADLNLPLNAIKVSFENKDVTNDRYDKYPKFEAVGIIVEVDNSKVSEVYPVGEGYRFK